MSNEVSEIQQIKNDFILLNKNLEMYFDPQMRVKFENVVVALQDIKARLNRLEIANSGFKDIEKRFEESLKFIKYLLDYFNPDEKMLQQIAEKDELIEKQKSELNTIKNKLKGLLK